MTSIFIRQHLFANIQQTYLVEFENLTFFRQLSTKTLKYRHNSIDAKIVLFRGQESIVMLYYFTCKKICCTKIIQLIRYHTNWRNFDALNKIAT